MSPWVGVLMRPPSWAFSAAVRLRNAYYDRRGPAHRVAGLPVLSVGNLTVGGTGKTPVVAWLAHWLLEHGRHPAVLSRGYGGRAGRGPLLVSNGSGPRVGPERCGDEPFLLGRAVSGAIVVVGSDRAAGAIAAREAGADVAILDDGFQHRRLGRDLDIVLVDASNPFGNYRLLPAGTLREPLSSLARADVVLITRSRAGESLVVIEKVVRRYNPRAPLLRAGHRRLGFVDAEGKPVPRPSRAVAFCGIGNPATFEHDLEAEGIELAASRRFLDHHRYSDADARSLAALAERLGARLLTTEKDLVRFPEQSLASADRAPIALRIEARIHDASALEDAVRDALTDGPR